MSTYTGKWIKDTHYSSILTMAALYGFKTRHDCTIFTKDEKKHILFKGVQMFSQAYRTTEAMLEDFFLSLK